MIPLNDEARRSPIGSGGDAPAVGAGSIRGARPVELTVVAVLGVASGVAQVGLGVVVIFGRYASGIAGTSSYAVVTVAGAALVLLGLLTVAVASGLRRGDRQARTVSTVLIALGVVGHAISALEGSSIPWAQAVAVVLSIAAIAVMWTGRSGKWFARPRP